MSHSRNSWWQNSPLHDDKIPRPHIFYSTIIRVSFVSTCFTINAQFGNSKYVRRQRLPQKGTISQCIMGKYRYYTNYTVIHVTDLYLPYMLYCFTCKCALKSLYTNSRIISLFINHMNSFIEFPTIGPIVKLPTFFSCCIWGNRWRRTCCELPELCIVCCTRKNKIWSYAENYIKVGHNFWTIL